MKTLCMDSAHKNLLIALIEDGEVKASICEECWKKQSETLFPTLVSLMEEVNWQVDDIEHVVITDGPGSYTGVRIAMTVAKVLCTRKNIPLSCISTLQLYAGIKENVFVLLDARSKRAYCAALDKGNFTLNEQILTLDEIRQLTENNNYAILGDTELLGIDKQEVDLVDNFKQLIPFARPIENIHTLVPRYLKDQDSYKVK